MARHTRPLTIPQIKNAKPKDKLYALLDGNGLQLRVTTTGSKTWLFDYTRPYTKVRTTMSFGRYPDISLAQAREKREEARALLAQNIDPKTHRDEEAFNKLAELKNTLKLISADWLELKMKKVTPEHAQRAYRSLELHIFPAHGNTPLQDIKAHAIIKTLRKLEDKGKLEEVKRVCQRLNEVMFFAVNSGFIDANPLAKISMMFEQPKKQHLPTIAPDELPKFIRTLSNASITPTTRCLIEWQLHTMVRPSEAAGAKWSEINLEEKVWIISAERMKKRKEHIVPLTKQTVALLEFMKTRSRFSEYVFPGDRHDDQPTNSATANRALKRMGYHRKLVSHGLRALASTILNESGRFNADVIESALAHTDKNNIRKAYNRAHYLELRREMMNWWSDHIEKSGLASVIAPTVKTAPKKVEKIIRFDKV